MEIEWVSELENSLSHSFLRVTLISSVNFASLGEKAMQPLFCVGSSHRQRAQLGCLSRLHVKVSPQTTARVARFYNASCSAGQKRIV